MTPRSLTVPRRLPGPLRLLTAAAAWPVASQQQACRNALGSSAAMARDRRERVEVEEFLSDLAARRTA